MTERFDPGEVMARFTHANRHAGAIVTFVGQVRPEDDVESLELFHYEPLTLPGVLKLADEALARWNLAGVFIRHRVGLLHPGEPIVIASAAATHRRDAFAATDFLMDHLKSAAWFWKRERRGGGWHWIEPRVQDHADRDRWAAEQ